MWNKSRLVKILSAFLMPLLLLLLTYWQVGLYPFGNHTVGYGDLANQYVALMSYFKENFTNYHNFLYSFSFSLGGNFFPVFAYYLSSPINLVALLFPVKDMLLFFELNVVFNAGLSGLTMYLYLTNSMWLNKNISSKNSTLSTVITLALSTSFALSAFFFDYSRCAMWFNAIAILPLVLWGLEKLIILKKPTLYIVTFSFLLLSNYYIGYIVTLFLVIVIIFWIIDSLLLSKNKIRTTFYRSCYILWSSLLPLMISAIYIIPSMLAQQNVNQEKIENSFKGMYKLSDLGPAMFPNIRPLNVPVIYTSLLVLVAIILYIVARKTTIKVSEKILSGLLLVVLFLSSWFTNTYMVWHVFTMPNGYPNRETFVISFVLVAIAYRGIQAYLSDGNILQCLLAGCITVAFFGLCVLKTGYFGARQVILISLVIVFYFIVLLFSNKYRGKLGMLLSLAVLLLLIFDIGYGNSRQMKYLAGASTDLDAYQRVVSKNKKVIDQVKSSSHNFSRLATTYQINPNDPLQFDYNGVQNYLSQQSTELTDFLSATGYFQKHSWLRWSTYNNGSTKAMDSLLGIKYVVGNSDNQFLGDIMKIKSLPANNWVTPRMYQSLWLKQGNFKVYHNSTVLPLALIVNGTGIRHGYHYNPTNNPFDLQNEIFQSLMKTNSKMFNQVQSPVVNRSANSITISYVPKFTGQGYIYIPFDINRLNSTNIKILVNNSVIATAFGSDLYGENGIISLGNQTVGQKVNIQITGINISEMYYLNPFIAIENEKLLQNFSSSNKYLIREENIRVRGNKINVDTQALKKPKNMLLTIPFDKGWVARDDGKQTKIFKSLGALSEIHLSTGEHRVVLSYHVPGITIALGITIIGLILSILTVVFERKNITLNKLFNW